MRHLLANLAVYALAAGLIIGSLLFAWVRSQQYVIAHQEVIEPREYVAATDPSEFDWEDFGKRVYVANCQNCHGSTGLGRDRYPGIRGQGAVVTADGGREYLARVMIYGLVTSNYPAPMPPMPNLTDAQIAAVNNYILTHFDDADAHDDLTLYVPQEVAAERGRTYSDREIGQQRPAVPLPDVLTEQQPPRR